MVWPQHPRCWAQNTSLIQILRHFDKIYATFVFALQAVAEFQGQFMIPKNLVNFFAQYVKSAGAGDDTVNAFKGNPDGKQEGVEADLDIQVMGASLQPYSVLLSHTPKAVIYHDPTVM